MASSGVLTDLRRLTGTAIVYAVGVVLVRGIAYLMLPILTRRLTAEDYGLVAVATSVGSLLLGLLPLGCDAALAKFYFTAKDDAERDDAVRTCWLTVTAVSVSIAVALELAGPFVARSVLPEVPWTPFLRAALWFSVFQIQIQFLGNLLRTRVEAAASVAVSAVTSLVQLSITLAFLLGFQRGAAGYLFGMAVAAGLSGLFSGVVLWKTTGGRFSAGLSRQMALFGLPLAPHIASGWLLELSDRALMRKFLTGEDVGIYSIGYQVGSLVAVLASCVNGAFAPYLLREVASGSEASPSRLARLATYYAAGLAWFALAVALGARPLIALLASPAYAEAADVVAWIAMAQWLVALYYVPTNMLTARGATAFISLATLVSASANVSANLFLVPRFGRMAAAWTTLGSYGLLLAIVGMAAARKAPLPYERRRIFLIAISLAVVLGTASQLPSVGWAAELALRGALLAAFPAVLILLGFANAAEWSAAGRFLLRLRIRERPSQVVNGRS